jgi:hypothetical protein
MIAVFVTFRYEGLHVQFRKARGHELLRVGLRGCRQSVLYRKAS